MPSLRLFYRRWNISTDEFVFSPVKDILLEIAVILCLICPFANDHSQFQHCLDHDSVKIGYFSTLIITTLMITLLLSVSYTSSRGVIMSEQDRRQMPVLLYLLVIFRLVYLFFSGFYASTLLFCYASGYLNPRCDKRFLYSNIAAIAILAVLNLKYFINAICAFMSQGGLWYRYYENQASSQHSSSSNLLEEIREKSRETWFSRFRLFCFPCSCKLDIRNYSALEAISLLFTNFFADLDFVKSDLTTGLMLLRLQTYLWMLAERFVPMQSLLSTTQVQIRADLAREDDAWLDLEVIHYMGRLATSMYNWPMQCLISPGRGCSICCCKCDRNTCLFSVLSKVNGVPPEDVIHLQHGNSALYSPTFAVMHSRKKNMLIVSIRGTLSKQDALVDMLAEGEMMLREELPEDSTEDFYVHKGMLYTARKIYQKLIKDRMLWHAINFPETEVVVCGHSLGAGLATILATLLRPLHPQIKCYAFSPPLGLMNKAMSEYCKSFVLSVVTDLDLVPRMSFHTMEDLKWRTWNVLHLCPLPKYIVRWRFYTSCLFTRAKHTARRTLQSLPRLFKLHLRQVHLVPLMCSFADYTRLFKTMDRELGQADQGHALQNSPMGPKPINCRLYPHPTRNLALWIQGDPKNFLLRDRNDNSGSPRWMVTSNGLGDSTPNYFSGLVLHVVSTDKPFESLVDVMTQYFFANRPNEKEKIPRAYAGKPIPVAVWSNVLQFQSIVVHPRMMLDHLPHKVCNYLERLIFLQKWHKEHFPNKVFPFLRNIQPKKAVIMTSARLGQKKF